MRRPNILLIAIDTLRRDHLGCYGYPHNISPNIDQLAAEGTCFDNIFVNNYPTMPSFTTLYTGLDGIEHGIVQHAGTKKLLSPKIPVLAERLRGAGYTTAAVDNIVTLRHGIPGWFSRGYDYYLGFRYDPSEERQARYITDRGLTLIDHLKSDPFFLMLHYWDPHVPYWPPEDAAILNRDPCPQDRPPLVEEFERQGDVASSLLLRSMMMGHVRSYDYVVSQYDEGIWNVDREIGRLLAGLKESNLDKDTMIVLLSDHGECFGEFGVHFDHSGPADANIRTPLIMRLPGEIAAGNRVAEYAQTWDITATLLQAAGVKQPDRLYGHGLLDAFKSSPYVVSAESFRQSSWILRNNKWKLVSPARDPRTDEPYVDLVGRPRGRPTLHDMTAPGLEGKDLADAEPEIARKMTAELNSWLDSRLEGRPDPVAAAGPSSTWESFVPFHESLINKYGDQPTRSRYNSVISAQSSRIVATNSWMPKT